MGYRSRKLGAVGTLIIGVIFAFIGYALLSWFVGPKTELGHASLRWPAVEGTMIRSEVNMTEKTEKRNGRTSKKKVYHADVAFTYSVGGRLYTNSTIDVGPSSSSNSSAGAYAVTNKYPQGARVSVYYNPKNPGESVLEPGVPTSLNVVRWFALAFLGIGLLLSGWVLLKAVLLGVILIAATKRTAAT